MYPPIHARLVPEEASYLQRVGIDPLDQSDLATRVSLALISSINDPKCPYGPGRYMNTNNPDL